MCRVADRGVTVALPPPSCPAPFWTATGLEAGLAHALARALAARDRPAVPPSGGEITENEQGPGQPPDHDPVGDLPSQGRDDAPSPSPSPSPSQSPSPSPAACPADTLPVGPGLAAWLSGQDLATASDHDAVAMASAWRRVASWAQAGELAAVAQVAARSAARDPDAGLEAGGRPACLTRDAAAQVSLELVLSRVGAEAWAGLALDLAWRLPGTAAALAEGRIDLVRAKIVAEAVAPLSDEAAAAVEARVLAQAGDWTYAQLRSAVRRAVIAVDPDGAEHRRQAAERRAKVSLYPDQDCTATLAGTRLPAAHAAAAMARVSALARALKAAGAGGGLDLLRAQVYLGLLLGSLPLIPPPAGGPPDADPPEDPPDDGYRPGGGPGVGGPPDGPRDGGCRPGGGPSDGSPDGPRGDGCQPGGSPGGGGPRPGDDAPPGGGPDDGDLPAGNGQAPDGVQGRALDAGSSDADSADPVGHGPPSPRGDSCPQGVGPPGADLPPAGPWTDAPPLTDADLPRDEGWRDMPLPAPTGYADQDPDRGDPADHELYADPGIIWPWPGAPISVGPRPGADDAAPSGRAGPEPGGGGGPPPGGLIDLTLSWATFTGTGQAPGTLGRIGAVTAPQARQLARMGVINHATQWRAIVTDHDGIAIAVARVPRLLRPSRAGPELAGEPPPAGAARGAAAPTIGRVTVVVPAASLDSARPDRELPIPAELTRISAQVSAAARRALDIARQQADADQHAPGGCAHMAASPAYRPPSRLRELVTARDQTCRNPRCGQPAWRGDLDHTRPYHLGGLTCGCNLGGFCRGDHRLKQLPGWTVTQPRPGVFTWTSPAGRAYTTRPDPHHAG